MNRFQIILLFLLLTNAVFGQKKRDTLIYNLPVVNDKLIYEGSRSVIGRNRAELDTLAKNWYFTYFKNSQINEKKNPLITTGTDTSSFLLNRGVILFHVKPGLINISFLALIRVKVTCTDFHYSYKIDSILFRPQNNTLNALGYQNDPEYLIKIYKRKHLGLSTAMDVTRGQIREYLSKMNATIRECIASLNKAMAN